MPSGGTLLKARRSDFVKEVSIHFHFSLGCKDLIRSLRFLWLATTEKIHCLTLQVVEIWKNNLADKGKKKPSFSMPKAIIVIIVSSTIISKKISQQSLWLRAALLRAWGVVSVKERVVELIEPAFFQIVSCAALL